MPPKINAMTTTPIQIIPIEHFVIRLLIFSGNNLFFKKSNSLQNDNKNAVENNAIITTNIVLITNKYKPSPFTFFVTIYEIKNVTVDITP